jgi:hypothetical protein
MLVYNGGCLSDEELKIFLEDILIHEKATRETWLQMNRHLFGCENCYARYKYRFFWRRHSAGAITLPE